MTYALIFLVCAKVCFWCYFEDKAKRCVEHGIKAREVAVASNALPETLTVTIPVSLSIYAIVNTSAFFYLFDVRRTIVITIVVRNQNRHIDHKPIYVSVTHT